MTREEKMEKRRENGKTYKYKPNPYKKGTKEYFKEAEERAKKKFSHKTPFARWSSVMAKLENQIIRQKLELNKTKQKTEKIK